MRCLFSPSSSSPFFYIDTGQKGLRCDAMRWVVGGQALGFNPAEPDVMRKPPRSREDSLISGWVPFFACLVIVYDFLMKLNDFS